MQYLIILNDDQVYLRDQAKATIKTHDSALTWTIRILGHELQRLRSRNNYLHDDYPISYLCLT